MGFRVLLIAVSDKTPERVQQEYGVAPTGQFDDVPETDVAGATLPNGAYLLYINDEIVPDNEVLGRLSLDASLLACYANETSMDSLASSWVDGVEQWGALHLAQEGVEHLETWGQLPVELAPIWKRQLEAQADDDEVDYLFEVPVELFEAMGGIRYDRDIEGAAPEPWEILRRI